MRELPHIATIHDMDFARVGSEGNGQPGLAELRGLDDWDVRLAARCVISQGGRIALQKLASENAVKVPGGGVRPNECIEDAVHRELSEEIGVTDCALRGLGIIVEYRSVWNMVQISQCFSAELAPDAIVQEPTEQGSSLVWAGSTQEALQTIEDMGTDTYDKRFMALRDTRMLEFYRDL